MSNNKTQLQPATNLEEVFELFDPVSDSYNNTQFYVPRIEKSLKKLSKTLKRGRRFHGFLCGHVGCGKTTDVDEVFTDLKKEFQPAIRDKELALLSHVRDKKMGWVNDIEPLLQSGAVVEYENGNIWLDIRYVLKEFVYQSLPNQHNIITD